MPTFSKLTYHIVFSTKYRKQSIGESIQERLYEYMGGIVRNIDGVLIRIGGIEDHVHLLANLRPSKSVSDCVRDIKSNSSKWMNEEAESRSRFEWQKGFSVFSVSHSQIDFVAQYFERQREHHQTVPFQQEYIEFLRRHEIPFDDDNFFESENAG